VIAPHNRHTNYSDLRLFIIIIIYLTLYIEQRYTGFFLGLMPIESIT